MADLALQCQVLHARRKILLLLILLLVIGMEVKMGKNGGQTQGKGKSLFGRQLCFIGEIDCQDIES